MPSRPPHYATPSTSGPIYSGKAAAVIISICVLFVAGCIFWLNSPENLRTYEAQDCLVEKAYLKETAGYRGLTRTDFMVRTDCGTFELPAEYEQRIFPGDTIDLKITTRAGLRSTPEVLRIQQD